MRKIFLLTWCFAFLALGFTSCHIASDEPEITDNDSAYVAVGTLTIPSSGFTKENVRTQIVLVNDNKLDIYMYDVKFAALMPVTIDMVISGVDYTQNDDMIRFYGDSIVPTAGNKPYDKYIVTDLTGSLTSDSLIISNMYGDTPCTYAGKRSK